MDTEERLNLLIELFPTYDKEILLDILVSCAGSVKKVKKLLLESCVEIKDSIAKSENKLEPKIEKQPIKEKKPKILETNTLKRKREEGQVVNQTSLSSLLKFPKINSTDTRKTITLYTKEDIERNLPFVRIIPNFLPNDLKEQVTNSLMSQRMLFKAKQFYIAGNLCTSSQKSIIYSNDDKTDYDPVYKSEDLRPHPFTNELIKCKLYVEKKVNEVLEEYCQKNKLPEYAITKNWKSDFCLGNYYPDNKSHLDLHSDKLTNIGPLPTIASLTIGATRIFRMRRSYPADSVIFNIPAPNNSLIIMLPGSQELFKHGVPTLKDSLYERDKITKDARFNLTYRMQYAPFDENDKVLCDICKKRMILRRLFKGPDIGYYVWMCMSSFKGQECKGFKYADFRKVNDKMNLFTTEKSEATRWLSESETLND